MTKMRKLKKSEYPICLAIGCPACPLCPQGYKYRECEFFNWKKENGKIRKVYEL